MGEEKRPDAEARREAKLDKEVADTFPASDPPSNTPVEGSRKAEQLRDKKQGGG